jgi:copper transport protein
MQLRRTGVLAALAAMWVLFLAPEASAHAVLVSSDPPTGAELTDPPGQVHLTFSEPPDLGVSVIHVLDAGGMEVEEGETAAVPGDPLAIRTAVGDLPHGVYTVTWRVLSRADGHITAGTFAFGVGVSPAGAGDPPGASDGHETPPPSPLAVTARWGMYAGLAGLLGAAVVGTFVSRTRPRGHRPILAAAWILAAGGLAALFLAQRARIGVPMGQLLDTGPGAHLVAMALALTVVGLAVATAIIVPRWTSLPALGLAAAAAMLVHVLGGHANAPSPTRGFNLAVQWLHLVAVGVWIGGLVWFFAHLRVTDPPDRARSVRRFSFIAGIALGAVAITGAVRLIDQVGGPAEWGRLFSTSFGLAAVAKIALFGGLVLLGARNRYVNVPGVAKGSRPVSSLRRTVAAELAIAAGVFGATGMMTELPPANVVEESRRESTALRPLTVTGNDFATTTRAKLTVSPGTVGQNRFEVRITDYDTAEPLPAERVSLRFGLPGRGEVAPSTLELEPSSEGVWTGSGSNLSLDGLWRVSILVQQAADSVEVDLDLAPRPPPQQIVAMEVPGQPTLYTITLSGGDTLQAYVDPGRAGVNQVHFTFFDAGGDELPVESPEVDALLLPGTPGEVTILPITPGHFSAEGEFGPGLWRFTVTATTEGGRVLRAYIQERIEG